MNKKEIVKLVKTFKKTNYKDLVGALIIYEFLENEYYYDIELEELKEEDLKTLDNIYVKWLKSDICGLLNEDLKELIEEEFEDIEEVDE